MRSDCLENIKDVLKVQVETDRDSLKSLLSDSKISITITKGPVVLTKLVKVATARKSTGTSKAKAKATIPEETRKKIKTQRVLLKNNTDALYIFTLIEKMKDNIKNLNLKDMTPEAASMFNSEIKDLITKLTSTQRLLIGKSK